MSDPGPIIRGIPGGGPIGRTISALSWWRAWPPAGPRVATMAAEEESGEED